MKPLPNNRCPNCQKPGPWLEGPFAPFCSRRCRLIDLGKWLGEEHRIPGPLRPEHFEADAELPPGANPDRPDPDEPL
jgi:uncharacterized protein